MCKMVQGCKLELECIASVHTPELSNTISTVARKTGKCRDAQKYGEHQ